MREPSSPRTYLAGLVDVDGADRYGLGELGLSTAETNPAEVGFEHVHPGSETGRSGLLSGGGTFLGGI